MLVNSLYFSIGFQHLMCSTESCGCEISRYTIYLWFMGSKNEEICISAEDSHPL